MPLSTDTLSVSATCEILHQLVSATGLLKIKGEISDFTQSAAGHCYFTLKDKNAAIRCVMFASIAIKSKLKVGIGSVVIITANASVYKKTGNMQLVITSIKQPDEQGALYLAFLKTKEALTKEGLFNETHKQQLPQYAQTIGVVTSATGSVRRDIEITYNKRFPIAQIIIFNCLVQGDGAINSICNALKTAINYNCPKLDCIIIARGGGSLEDLQAFNSEQLVRAIYSCPIPTISAVGHQTDISLTDFVADVTAATPTAAVEILSPAKEDILLFLDECQKSMQRNLNRAINNFEQKLTTQKTYLNNKSKEVIQKYEHSLQLIKMSFNSSGNNQIQKQENLVQIIKQNIQTKNPQTILNKGFAFITNSTKKPVNSCLKAKTGDNIKIQLADGKISAKIT